MIPHITFYTDNLPPTSAGRAYGPVILIRKGYENDIGIMEHELEHVRQWWVHGLLIHSLMYIFSQRYRQWSEVRAYRIQLEYPHPRYTKDQLREMYATWLSIPEPEGYGLQDICTKEQALQLLS